MYYIAKSALNWGDNEFWDSSPKFLYTQFDLYVKHNKQQKNKNKNKVESKKEVKKYKILDSMVGD